VRDITVIALWGMLNLCSFFYVLEGAVILLLLVLATEHRIKLAWLGIPGLIAARLCSRQIWWTDTGYPDKPVFLEMLWVVLAAVVAVQSVCFFVSSERRGANAVSN
jgi:hypothetical protein